MRSRVASAKVVTRNDDDDVEEAAIKSSSFNHDENNNFGRKWIFFCVGVFLGILLTLSLRPKEPPLALQTFHRNVQSAYRAHKKAKQDYLKAYREVSRKFRLGEIGGDVEAVMSSVVTPGQEERETESDTTPTAAISEEVEEEVREEEAKEAPELGLNKDVKEALPSVYDIQNTMSHAKIISLSVSDHTPGHDNLYYSYSTQSKALHGWDRVSTTLRASGCKYGVFHCKIKNTLEYLEKQTSLELRDLVLFHDAFDVLFFQKPETARERWEELVHDNKWNRSQVVLFNAESNCYPNTTACDVQRKRYASSATHMVSGSKEVVSWLNSGVYMGTIDAVIHMLRSANALYSSGQNWWGGDQHVFHELCYMSAVHSDFECMLDVSQTMFRTAYPYDNSNVGPGKSSLIIKRWADVARDSAVTIHFNGKAGNDDFIEWILKELVS